MIDYTLMRKYFTLMYTDVMVSAKSDSTTHAENVPCHLSIIRNDVANKFGSGTPAVYGRVSFPLTESVHKGDTVVVNRIDPVSGAVLAIYTGTAGFPAVFQSRKSFDFEVTKVEQGEAPGPDPKPIEYQIAYNAEPHIDGHFTTFEGYDCQLSLDEANHVVYFGTGFVEVDGVLSWEYDREMPSRFTKPIGKFNVFQTTQAPTHSIVLQEAPVKGADGVFSAHYCDILPESTTMRVLVEGYEGSMYEPVDMGSPIYVSTADRTQVQTDTVWANGVMGCTDLTASEVTMFVLLPRYIDRASGNRNPVNMLLESTSGNVMSLTAGNYIEITVDGAPKEFEVTSADPVEIQLFTEIDESDIYSLPAMQSQTVHLTEVSPAMI